jgi:rhodanese-related sulfurtransferase
MKNEVAGDKAPSQAFPVMRHVAAGAVLLVLGFVMMFMPDYKTQLIRKVSNPSFQTSLGIQTMVPDELAFRIVDQEPHTRILDLRPAVAFSALALPGSVKLPQADLFSNDLGSSIAQRHGKKVIVAENETQERQAYLLLHELGYENLAILEGGYPVFDAAFLHPLPFVPVGNRRDDDVLRFRKDAQTRIPQLIEAQKAAATKAPTKEKKIQGGC